MAVSKKPSTFEELSVWMDGYDRGVEIVTEVIAMAKQINAEIVLDILEKEQKRTGLGFIQYQRIKELINE